jgi:hypothetical protein
MGGLFCLVTVMLVPTVLKTETGPLPSRLLWTCSEVAVTNTLLSSGRQSNTNKPRHRDCTLIPSNSKSESFVSLIVKVQIVIVLTDGMLNLVISRLNVHLTYTPRLHSPAFALRYTIVNASVSWLQSLAPAFALANIKYCLASRLD